MVKCFHTSLISVFPIIIGSFIFSFATVNGQSPGFLNSETDQVVEVEREKENDTTHIKPQAEESQFFFDINKIEIKEFSRNLEFHGFLEMGWPINGHNEDAFEESTNVFDQTSLTLWFGIEVLKDISFFSEIEIEDGFGELSFEKFEFDWKIINDLMVLKSGKFVYPFGIERLVEDAPSNKLVSRPSPFMRIIPGTYSDNGLEVYGAVPLISALRLKYEIALTAGLSSPARKGEQSFDENNDSKSLGGRLGFIIFPSLEIGSSYSTGKYDDSDKSRMDFAGVDLRFQKGGFELRSEYIRSNVEGLGSETDSYDRDGYYVQLSYKYLPEYNYLRFLEGTTRFDSVDPNDLFTNESDTERVSFGLNYSPFEHLILKLEYILEDETKEELEKNLLFQTVFSW